MSTQIKEKQKELKEWIIKIGMNQKSFVSQYYIERSYNYTEKEIEQYYEKFKKELSRKTTKLEVLDKYFKFLYTLEEFKKIYYIKPYSFDSKEFDKEFNFRMKEISKSITEKLLEKEL